VILTAFVFKVYKVKPIYSTGKTIIEFRESQKSFIFLNLSSKDKAYTIAIGYLHVTFTVPARYWARWQLFTAGINYQ
jgi:hypothetical protein